MCLSYRSPYFSICVHHRRLMKAQLKVAEEAAGKAAQLRAEAAEFRGNPTGNVPFFMGKITGNRLAICYMNHSGTKNLKKLVRRHETNLGMLKVKLTHSPKMGKFWDMSSQKYQVLSAVTLPAAFLRRQVELSLQKAQQELQTTMASRCPSQCPMDGYRWLYIMEMNEETRVITCI